MVKVASQFWVPGLASPNIMCLSGGRNFGEGFRLQGHAAELLRPAELHAAWLWSIGCSCHRRIYIYMVDAWSFKELPYHTVTDTIGI